MMPQKDPTPRLHEFDKGVAYISSAYAAHIHRARIDYRVKKLRLDKIDELEGWTHEYKKSERYEHGVHILRFNKTTITIFHNKDGTYTLQVVSTSLEECREAFEQVALSLEAFDYEEMPRYLELYIRYHERKERAVCEALEAFADVYAFKQSSVWKWHEGKRVAYVNRVQAQLRGYVIHAKTYRHKRWRSEEGARRHPKLEVVVYFKGKEVARGIDVARRALATLAKFANLRRRDILEAGEEGLLQVLCEPDPEMLRLLNARHGRSVVEKIARESLETRREQLLWLLKQGYSLKVAAKIMRISYRHARRIAAECKRRGELVRRGRKWIVKAKRLRLEEERKKLVPIIHIDELDKDARRMLLEQLSLEAVQDHTIIARKGEERLIIKCKLAPRKVYECQVCHRELTWIGESAPACPYCGAILDLKNLKRVVIDVV